MIVVYKQRAIHLVVINHTFIQHMGPKGLNALSLRSLSET